MRDERYDARGADAVHGIRDERGPVDRERDGLAVLLVAEAVAEQELRAVTRMIDGDAVERGEPTDVGVGEAADDVDVLVREAAINASALG